MGLYHEIDRLWVSEHAAMLPRVRPQRHRSTPVDQGILGEPAQRKPRPVVVSKRERPAVRSQTSRAVESH